MEKILSIKLPLAQIILSWCLRIMISFFICACIYNVNENPIGLVSLSFLLLLPLIFLIIEEKILIYKDCFIFQKKYFFNLVRKEKKFNYLEILETDASGINMINHGILNKFHIIQNDKNIIIKTQLFRSNLEKAKEQINQQIKIYKNNNADIRQTKH
jgi:hypothetical protein